MQPTVLVVEDDPSIRQGLSDALGFAGYKVVERGDGPSGLEAAQAVSLDLVLLDVMLPGIDGFAVLDKIRDCKPSLPVIMVTARGAEKDCVQGLQRGADDYVVKPFSAKELLARVEAVLRRSAERPLDVETLEIAGRKVDLKRRELHTPSGAVHTLSEKEADILRYLASHPGRAVAREELLQRIWGFNPHRVKTRTVDMHIARLREKLEDNPNNGTVIVTVRSKGYMLGNQEE